MMSLMAVGTPDFDHSGVCPPLCEVAHTSARAGAPSCPGKFGQPISANEQYPVDVEKNAACCPDRKDNVHFGSKADMTASQRGYCMSAKWISLGSNFIKHFPTLSLLGRDPQCQIPRQKICRSRRVVSDMCRSIHFVSDRTSHTCLGKVEVQSIWHSVRVRA